MRLNLKQLRQIINEDLIREHEPWYGAAVNAAKNGDRVVFVPAAGGKPSTIWGGVGNRSGLHSFVYELLDEKWKKSGERFKKKLESLPDGKIEIHYFRNTTRDRGRWVKETTYRII